MSLENLTEAERRMLNLGNIMAEVLGDPKLSREAKRILKAKKPELQFPELEQEDALEKVRLENKAETEKLQAELTRRDAIAALAKETEKIEEAGLDPKAVREFMEKKGITDVDVVIELFQSRVQLAEPSSDVGGGGPFHLKDVTKEDLAKMWNNPSAWRQEKGLAIQKEMRGQRRVA
jgi:hypothetical protein